MPIYARFPFRPDAGFPTVTKLRVSRVAVLGVELTKTLYNGRLAVGTTIMLNNVPFQVIGVLEKVGREGNNGTNIRIFIPVSTMREYFPLKDQNSENAISFINYQPITR